MTSMSLDSAATTASTSCNASRGSAAVQPSDVDRLSSSAVAVVAPWTRGSPSIAVSLPVLLFPFRSGGQDFLAGSGAAAEVALDEGGVVQQVGAGGGCHHGTLRQ